MNGIAPHRLTRRGVLRATAAAGAMVFAPAILRAAVKHTRKNVASPEAADDLKSYRDAVEAMLKLPPEDPRNWYRNAFIHLLDCPHGNWWFTSWHRGYLGYFEQICRELSGNPDFALPYWDWTADPAVPASLFGSDNPLDPVNYPLYVVDHPAFDAAFRGPLESMWNAMTPEQVDEQHKRMNMTFDQFWSDPENGAMPQFADRPNARFLAAASPNLDSNARKLVAIERIKADLTPTIFAPGASGGVAFENPVTTSHQLVQGFSLLSGTHNIVHMSVGGTLDSKNAYVPPYGLMSQNLSSADPIFFLHHSNIDRLWDVWTRKQQALGLPTGPDETQAQTYKPEPYLFFVNAKGEPVTDRTTAWDYFEIGGFDYEYQPGSGEEVVETPIARLAAPRSFAMAAVRDRGQFGNDVAASADLVVPQDLLTSVQENTNRSTQFAQVSFVPPPNAIGKLFQVFISPEGTPPDLDPEGPGFAGSFVFFGHPHDHGAPVSFTIPIDGALDRMSQAGRLHAGQQISFSLVAAGQEVTAPGAAQSGELQSVHVEVL